MTEPQNPPLAPLDTPVPALDLGNAPRPPEHRDFLPPASLEPPGGAGKLGNPTLPAGYRDAEAVRPPPLAPRAGETVAAGPFGEIRNPTLQAAEHGDEIRNPPLGPPDRVGYGEKGSGPDP